MQNQKIENVLNLSLSVSETQREKSEELEVGFDPEIRLWEVIIKYHGSLEGISSGIVIEPLIAGYAIATVPETALPSFTAREQIEYIEKPKRLFFSAERGKRASCITQVTNQAPFLSGKGTVIAVLDSGIDYRHPLFIREDGTTKIAAIWDQSVEPTDENGLESPIGFRQGALISGERIQMALQENDVVEQNRLVPSYDRSGHGTAVAGIATQVAPDSQLLIVKLGKPRENGFPSTTELMRGITFVTRWSVQRNLPVSINLSFGNTYGFHDGTSLLERFLDNASEIGKSVICVGNGNEATSQGHLTGIVSVGNQEQIELSVGEYENSFSVQIWKDFQDTISIRIESPDGLSQVIPQTPGAASLRFRDAEVLVYVGEPAPYSVNQEIYLDFIPTGQYLSSGIWSFYITPESIMNGRYSLYLPSSNALSGGTGFYQSSPERTLTIPATSSRSISVGAYDTTSDSYADFSGRGYVLTQTTEIGDVIIGVKPELTAPGVNIRSARVGGDYGLYTGTSFAVPFVTGSAALLMEWGIVNNQDPYLYGEKVKAYLIKGARQLAGMVTPNSMTGWGALCVRSSLPVI